MTSRWGIPKFLGLSYDRLSLHGRSIGMDSNSIHPIPHYSLDF